MTVATQLVLSCEHATNHVPARFASPFQSARARKQLVSHRGLDLGALAVARHLGRAADVPVRAFPITRLLIDPNRSLHHPAVFSAYAWRLSAEQRGELIERYYTPHRQALQSDIERRVRRGQRVLHVAVHSFVPRLHGKTRNAEVGLLYDPARSAERTLARAWQLNLKGLRLGRVRRNYPYRGVADGLPTALRAVFPHDRYLGIELELNQALLTTPAACRAVARRLWATMPR